MLMRTLSFVLKFLGSYYLTVFLMATLATAAGVATFIENDFGTHTAKLLVYNAFWHEVVFFFLCVNFLIVAFRNKLYKKPSVLLLHSSFIVILIGASVTRYQGFEGIMHIREGDSVSRMLSTQPFFQIKITNGELEGVQEIPLYIGDLGDNDFRFNADFLGKELLIQYISHAPMPNMQEFTSLVVGVSYGNEVQETSMLGSNKLKGFSSIQSFENNVTVEMEWGGKVLQLPFALHLKDFILDKYPGTNSPSSYKSVVQLQDESNDISIDYEIYMNNVFSHGDYTFYQSSYDKDELGTVLSVNNDPGKIPTYLGYLLLLIGFLWSLFNPKGRFLKLYGFLAKNTTKIFSLALFVFLSNAADLRAEETIQNRLDNDNIVYLKQFKQNTKEHIDKFGSILIQDATGRVKPISTLSYDIMNKIARKSNLFGFEPTQIILGMSLDPSVWRQLKMIKISHPQLKKMLDVSPEETHLAFKDFFNTEGVYKLQIYASGAMQKAEKEKSTFDKEVLRVDERVQISHMIYSGLLLKIFPTDKLNAPWLTFREGVNTKSDLSDMIISYISALKEGIKTGDMQTADAYAVGMKNYQYKKAFALIPNDFKIQTEQFFYDYPVLGYFKFVYLLVGILVFIVFVVSMFSKSLWVKYSYIFFYYLSVILWAVHLAVLGIRWYISGHAPWSDAYESLIYIAFMILTAGILFARKSILALSASLLLSSVILIVAHLNFIDPQITTLVPVLKSYWLVIHVAIITGSYGFFGLAFMLSVLCLLLFLFKYLYADEEFLNRQIKNVTYIVEMAMIIGLAMLTIGNFLGGVWANESWGRYWGWDPKETWAYVSILVYALGIHIRFLPVIKNYAFALNLYSSLAFSTIVMTYMGVNFFLSGLHSYASGDSVEMPNIVYYSLYVIIALNVGAFFKREVGK